MGGAKHLGALPCRRQCRWAWELKNGWQAATNVVCCALVWAGEGQQGGTSNLHGTHWLTQHPPLDCTHPHTNPCGARHLNCTSAVWLLLGRVYSQAPCLLAARCMTTNSHHPSPTTTHPPPQVEEYTLQKAANLVLNVDGCIGALFLDLLNSGGVVG